MSSQQLETVLGNLQENLQMFRQSRDEAQAIVERWNDRIAQTEESIAEVEAALRFGVKVGDTVTIKGKGLTWRQELARGVITKLAPSFIPNEVTALLDIDGTLHGYTLDRYVVEVVA